MAEVEGGGLGMLDEGDSSTMAQNTKALPQDPLDGMLVGWPSLDKQELRREQHEAKLARAGLDRP